MNHPTSTQAPARRRPIRKAPWALAAGIALLLLLWPAQAFAADSFDLQAAINACPAGGTVTVPAGTYTLSQPVTFKSGVTVQGAGASSTVFYMPTQPSSGKAMFLVRSVSNVTIRDIGLKSDTHDGYVWAIDASDFVGLSLERVAITNCFYGLKSAGSASNLTVSDFVVTGTGCPLHLARLTGGTFSNLDLSSDATVNGDWAAHGIYIDADNHNLSFTNVKIGTVESYGLHMYSDYGWSQPSNDISFDGLTINSRRGIMVGDGFDRVTLRNIKVTQQLIDDGALMIGAPHNVLVENFAVAGGWYFMMALGGDQSPASLTLRNGAWNSSAYSNSTAGILDLTAQNVVKGTVIPATTTTTVAPTTTTTAAPTTTTTAAPTTTTTMAPTTTTTVPPTTTTTMAPTTTTTAAPTTTTTAAPSTTVTSVPTSSPTGSTSPLTISNPLGSATVTGKVTIKASAASTLRVFKVGFFIDGRFRAVDYTATYSYLWNTSTLATGTSHSVTAIAYDRLGNVLGTATVKVTKG